MGILLSQKNLFKMFGGVSFMGMFIHVQCVVSEILFVFEFNKTSGENELYTFAFVMLEGFRVKSIFKGI